MAKDKQALGKGVKKGKKMQKKPTFDTLFENRRQKTTDLLNKYRKVKLTLPKSELSSLLPILYFFNFSPLEAFFFLLKQICKCLLNQKLMNYINLKKTNKFL